ncbi:Serine/threonine-protein kinase PknB [Enhygromyxa salina]|uniref:Serine/threonine-protein kinase PknB n=2 Tax=Enhygromyxa salina TaxID=215803 RepID=A0A0C1Z9C4_9BACT|nr:Serine/threonine-protein kinase PknB [Enhygromyxa salina]
MARVYAGEEVLSHRRVALKVLRAEFARSEKGRQQFLTEMRILANIDDPHIVRCLLCTEIEEQPVMVLEQLDGWTLRTMLDNRVAVPWREAVGYAQQIAKALNTAHSHHPRVIHRDLKPENIMCLADGRVKVMDFGIAKVLQTLSGSTTHPIGTMQYMSPEHIDAKQIDPRSDLFALGLIMWEMLAGRPPFMAESPRSMLEQLCTHPTPPLPEHAREGLPPALERLIYRLLEKDREARPSSAAEVVASLAPLCSTAPHAPSPTPPGMPFVPSVAQPALETAEVIEPARKGAFRAQVDEVKVMAEEVSDAVDRFGQATATLIVRVLVGLLLFPAAAVFFIGLPLVLAYVDQAILENAGSNLRWTELEPLVTPGLVLLPITALIVVFVRSSWAHRRTPSEAGGVLLRVWLGIGGLLIVCSIATTAMELGASQLTPNIHYSLIVSCSLWLMLSLCWATGRIVSRLLRRLDHNQEAAG